MKPILFALTGLALTGALAAATGLDDELAATRAALAKETQSLEADASALEAEARGLEDELRGLAAQLVDAELEAAALRRREADLNRAQADLAGRASEAEALLATHAAASRGLAERLSLALEEVPGAGPRREEARALVAALSVADPSPEDLARPFTFAAALLAEARVVELVERPVFLASGERELVKLLRLGLVTAAYERSDGRLGIAIASPREASGFRWTEDLPPTAREQLRAAFRAAEAGAPTLSPPVDVTGRLRASVLADSRDLWETIQTGGWVMVPLGGVALLALLIMLERWLVFSLQGTPGRQLRPLLEAASAGRLDEAEAAAKGARGVCGRVLAALLARRERGASGMENAVQEQLLYELPKLQARLGGIAVLGAIAPLLGLLGTVTGIIQTFGVIKVYGNANPGLLAGGISEALITTAAGLVIAIPILLGHSLLSARLDRLLGDAEKYAATLLNLCLADADRRAEAAEARPAAASPVEPPLAPPSAPEASGEAPE